MDMEGCRYHLLSNCFPLQPSADNAPPDTFSSEDWYQIVTDEILALESMYVDAVTTFSPLPQSEVRREMSTLR